MYAHDCCYLTQPLWAEPEGCAPLSLRPGYGIMECCVQGTPPGSGGEHHLNITKAVSYFTCRTMSWCLTCTGQEVLSLEEARLTSDQPNLRTQEKQSHLYNKASGHNSWGVQMFPSPCFGYYFYSIILSLEHHRRDLHSSARPIPFKCQYCDLCRHDGHL